jgi:LysR family transcriptional regulator, mexEF-oprN operon transcriptional activator
VTEPTHTEPDQAAVDDAGIRRLAAIDLNLLVVFAALMQHRSVTVAAQRLFLGQPAVSAALRRLRGLFGDPLLVKAGRGMVATARAEALLPAVTLALAQIDALAAPPAAFDPTTSRATLRLGLSDDFEVLLLPAIARELAQRAPLVRLVARPISHLNIRESLDSGAVDFGFSVFGELSSWHQSEVLLEQGYGCIYDPVVLGSNAPSTLAAYVNSEQLIVTFDGALEGKIDRHLAEAQLQRNARVGTTRFTTLPYLVKGTARVASVPELVGRALAHDHGLAFCPLPLQVPPGKPRLAWHRRSEHDPAGRWFRELFAACLRRRVAEIRPVT